MEGIFILDRNIETRKREMKLGSLTISPCAYNSPNTIALTIQEYEKPDGNEDPCKACKQPIYVQPFAEFSPQIEHPSHKVTELFVVCVC